MNPKQQDYSELLALTQIYLLQNKEKGDWITSDIENFQHFKQQALKQRKSAPVAIKEQPKVTVAPVPPSPQITPQSAPITQPIQKKNVPQPPPEPQIEKTKPLPLPKVHTESLNKSPETIKTSFISDKQITLETPSVIPSCDFSDWRKILSEKMPSLPIVDLIPSDEEARRINSAWKHKTALPEILILSFQETAKEIEFLENVTKAIDAQIAPAALVAARNLVFDYGLDFLRKPEKTRLIIASAYGLNTSRELMEHYKETAKTAQFFLGKIPLYLLTDISLYMREPKLKKALWHDLLAYKLVNVRK